MAGVTEKRRAHALLALDEYARDLDQAIAEHRAAGGQEACAELQRERELVRQAETLLGDSIDSTGRKG